MSQVEEGVSYNVDCGEEGIIVNYYYGNSCEGDLITSAPIFTYDTCSPEADIQENYDLDGGMFQSYKATCEVPSIPFDWVSGIKLYSEDQDDAISFFFLLLEFLILSFVLFCFGFRLQR